MQQPVTGMKMYVEAVVSAMDLFFDRPFAFFGHSLGALVAYEVTLELRRRSLPVPIYLVVSANIAPQLHFPGDIPSLSEDSKKRSEFVEKVRPNIARCCASTHTDLCSGGPRVGFYHPGGIGEFRPVECHAAPTPR